MAKFIKASEDIDTIVNDVANELGLINYGVNFEAFHVPNLKEVATCVRANGYAEYFAGREDLVLVLVREDLMDEVDEATKYLWIRMAMEPISYDTEKDKLVIGCPTLKIPLALYEKYGDTIVKSASLQLYAIAQWEEKEKERKLQEKNNKKSKKNKKY